MRSRILIVLAACLPLTLLSACGAFGGSGGSGDNPLQFREEVTKSTLEPSVRKVHQADINLLWEAARGYVERYFPLDVDDEVKHVAETQTWEWEHNRMRYRSRITVEVIRDPLSMGTAKLGVLARMKQQRGVLEAMATGTRPSDEWVLIGTHNDMQSYVADQIVNRYMLLKQGRNPDEEPLRDDTRKTLMGLRPSETGN